MRQARDMNTEYQRRGMESTKIKNQDLTPDLLSSEAVSDDPDGQSIGDIESHGEQAAEALEKQSQAVIQALLDRSGDAGTGPDPVGEQRRVVNG